MKKPIILAVDDDQQVLSALRQDLRKNFKNNFRIISTTDAQEALDSLKELLNKGEEVALFLSDQRMPGINGTQFLEQAKKYYPKARRVLLTAYSDTDAAIAAINKVQLDYYLLKPWDPPEEKLYPVLEDLLDQWQAEFVPPFSGLRVVGYQFSAQSHALKDYLAGNLFPYRWLDFENSTDAQKLISENQLEASHLPALFFEDGSYLCKPTVKEVAEKLGLNPKAQADLYDVVIIGAGPAGLAASVYGASEGLKTLLIEKHAPGGQAGTSSRIENYLGFPKGLSGSELARRAITQSSRLGAEFLSPAEVAEIKISDQNKIVALADGSEILTRSVVITTGVDYRKLDTKGLAELTGAGVFYGAATTEANSCKSKPVFVVGGGNSAGQAAMYLAQFASQVNILIRRADLTSSMSAYLIDQIAATSNISLRPFSEVTEAFGEGHLEHLNIKNSQSSETTKETAAALFIFIGAKPYTQWISDNIEKDAKGFIKTGRDLSELTHFAKSYGRDPYLLETSTPGVFAAGDTRSGAMNRVASAVGEGAMSISFVHKYLAEV